MRHLLIPYPDSNEFAVVYPVVRANLMLFDMATTRLREKWIALRFNTEALVESEWWLIGKIAGLLRSADDFPFDVERIKDDVEAIQRLFLVNPSDDGSVTETIKDEYGNELVGEDGKPIIRLRASQLLGLNLFERRKSPPKSEDAPIDPPFPTSGDADCDILANLMGPFGVDGALRLVQEFDQESIENLLYAWNELQKPIEDRRQEYVAKLFLNEMETDEYQRSLYEDW